MINYVFYIKANPMGSSLKIGISAMKHLGSRLGTYQNSFGPDYEDRFEAIWVGPEQDVRELERLLKIKYRAKIAGSKRGLTEWIKGVPFDNLVKDINITITGLGVEVTAHSVKKVFESEIDAIKEQYLVEEIVKQ
jgi:hypothetical protein